MTNTTTNAQVTVRFEGSEFTVDAETGLDDAKLRNVLQPVFPDAQSAEIHRTNEGGKTVVSLLPKSVHKGASPRGAHAPSTPQQRVLAALRGARETVNPAVTLCAELQDLERRGELDVRARVLYRPAIEKAIKDGDSWMKQVEASRKRLSAAAPVPSRSVPVGF